MIFPEDNYAALDEMTERIRHRKTALNHFRKTMKSRFVEHLQLFITSRGRIVARLVGF
jgi:antitoxin (DNA-binding transcriptional repressor) of toxin-antitoxin stability system